jgi:hypothetical protein
MSTLHYQSGTLCTFGIAVLFPSLAATKKLGVPIFIIVYRQTWADLKKQIVMKAWETTQKVYIVSNNYQKMYP